MSESHEPFVKVGIGVMVLKDGRVLLNHRIGSHGADTYAFAGGHLEHMESLEECARRETLEECGIRIKNIRFQFVANLKTYAPKHYLHVGLVADWAEGEPCVLEPEMSKGWAWYALDALPQPLFESCKTAFESYWTGRNYFDA